MSNSNELERKIARLKKEIERELYDRLPRKVGIVAVRHSNAIVTTAAIDNLQFTKPAFAGQMVVLCGRVTYVGRTAMEIRVDTYTEALDGTRQHINKAYIDMVAINNEGQAIEVPALELETEEQRAEYEAAIKRKEMRKQRRLEDF